MSVKHVLLELLAETPAGSYQLKQAFEECTGGIWPMNIGQVYQTVQRLERDGLVEIVGETGEGNRRADIYGVTEGGREALREWWQTPVVKAESDRDDLVMRMILATKAPPVDVVDQIQQQRLAVLREIRTATTELREHDGSNLTQYLQLQRRIFNLEAEDRWLEHIEQIVTRAQHAIRERTSDD